MKVTVRNLTILALTMLAFNQANAQKAGYTTNGGMTIGFGIGGSYQSSDITNSIGAGFDFWLGHHIYKKENAFLGVDWKFRFLTGENNAHDHRINLDSTYSNIRYNFYNYDLELGFTLNRLRERTRIVVTGFAGAGITHGLTFTDLYDSSGNFYDYSLVDPNNPRSQVNADLLNLSDQDYETPLSNRAAILPTAGIYIGYQFSRSFSMGIEHKTNFSLNENNSTFGIDIDNNIATGSPIDMNHYTSLGFRWSMGGRSSRNANRNNFSGADRTPITYNNVNTTRPVTTTKPVTTTRPITTTRPVTVPPVKEAPVKVASPEIRFINPASPVTVENNLFSLRVQTTNIGAWQDVEVSIDGVSNSNFSFSREGVVTLNIGLKDGPNSTCRVAFRVRCFYSFNMERSCYFPLMSYA